MKEGRTDPPRDGEGDRAKRGGGGSAQLQRPVVYSARRLRRQMTLPEVMLWQQLRQRPGGLKFRRQHPIEPYVVDFFCREAALVVEVDGAAHNDPEHCSRDERRDAQLRERALTVIRIPAAEVMHDPAAVAEWISMRAGSPLHHHSGGPPPRAGED